MSNIKREKETYDVSREEENGKREETSGVNSSTRNDA